MYIVIASSLLAIIISLYFALAHARTKQQTITEVETQGMHALRLITQAIHNAQSIGTVSTSSITITTGTSSTNPTVFYVASSTIHIKEGVKIPIALTNTNVNVSNAMFTNLSTTTAGSIQIQFTLSHATTSDRQNTSYIKTFYGSATVRKVIQ